MQEENKLLNYLSNYLSTEKKEEENMVDNSNLLGDVLQVKPEKTNISPKITEIEPIITNITKNNQEIKEKTTKKANLTPKQEKFCILVAREFKTLTDAYKLSYNLTTENKDTINNLAYKLYKDNKIRARINELRKEIDESSYWSTNDFIKTIDFLLVECLEKKQKVERIKEVEVGVDLFGEPIFEKIKEIEIIDKANIDKSIKLLDMRAKLTGKYKEETNNNIVLAGDINFNLNTIKNDKQNILNNIFNNNKDNQ